MLSDIHYMTTRNILLHANSRVEFFNTTKIHLNFMLFTTLLHVPHQELDSIFLVFSNFFIFTSSSFLFPFSFFALSQLSLPSFLPLLYSFLWIFLQESIGILVLICGKVAFQCYVSLFWLVLKVLLKNL